MGTTVGLKSGDWRSGTFLREDHIRGPDVCKLRRQCPLVPSTTRPAELVVETRADRTRALGSRTRNHRVPFVVSSLTSLLAVPSGFVTDLPPVAVSVPGSHSHTGVLGSRSSRFTLNVPGPDRISSRVPGSPTSDCEHQVEGLVQEARCIKLLDDARPVTSLRMHLVQMEPSGHPS